MPVPLSTQASVLLPSRSESTKLPVLVHRVADPIDSWILANGLVCSINQDNLKIFVSRILIKPVGIEDLETTQFPPSTLLCNRTLAALKFQLCDPLVCGFTIHNTFRNRPFSPTTPYTYSVDHIALFGLVAQATGLIWASGVSDPHDGRVLAVLPTPHPLQKPHDI